MRLAAGCGEIVVAHSDWRAEHVRFEGEEIVAAYDWQSLALAREPELVGAAAHAFTADWGYPKPVDSSPSTKQKPSWPTTRRRAARALLEVDDYSRGMRLAMRVLFVLAIPGLVFGWLTRLPPLRFELELDFFAPEVGWIDVLAALTVATAVVVLIAALVVVLIKLDIGTDKRVSRRARR